MIRETETAANRFAPLHLQMIGIVEACLCKLRDMALNTQRLRISYKRNTIGDLDLERNRLVALLGELHASKKRMEALEDAVKGEANVLKAINKLRERVQDAQKHYMPEGVVYRQSFALAS